MLSSTVTDVKLNCGVWLSLSLLEGECETTWLSEWRLHITSWRKSATAVKWKLTRKERDLFSERMHIIVSVSRLCLIRPHESLFKAKPRWLFAVENFLLLYNQPASRWLQVRTDHNEQWRNRVHWALMSLCPLRLLCLCWRKPKQNNRNT